MLKAFSDASDPAPLTRDLGPVFHLDATSIKPYSCCGSTHSYVDAAFELRRRLGTPWNAQRRVRVGMAKVVDVQCGFDYVPGTALNAQMSLRYVVAAALLEGQALPPQFTDEKMADPALVGLAQRIELEHDAGARQALSRALRRLGRGRRQRATGCARTCSIRWAPPPTRSTRKA